MSAACTCGCHAFDGAPHRTTCKACGHGPVTCTVVVGAPMVRCGQPAVVTFTGRNGETFGECSEHAWDVQAAPTTTVVQRTRSRRPFLLVQHGAIVGYADAVTPAVEARARRMRATIIPNPWL